MAIPDTLTSKATEPGGTGQTVTIPMDEFAHLRAIEATARRFTRSGFYPTAAMSQPQCEAYIALRDTLLSGSNKGASRLGVPSNPFVLGLMIVCDACGSLMNGEYVLPEGGKQMVVAVDKCACDSPLLSQDSDQEGRPKEPARPSDPRGGATKAR